MFLFSTGEEGSVVTAHVSESGILTASIATTSETYHIEPSENFIKRPHPHHMIAYRASDVKKRAERTKFDFVVAPPLPPEAQTETTKDHNSDQLNHKTNTLANGRDIPLNDHQTVKRQSQGNIGGSSCSMILVADYRFFREFGARSDVNMSMAGITRRLVSDVEMKMKIVMLHTSSTLFPLPLSPSLSLLPPSLPPSPPSPSLPPSILDYSSVTGRHNHLQADSLEPRPY